MRLGILVTMLLVPCGTALADDCRTIKFRHGESGAIVTGTARSVPDSMTCFTLEVGAGQTATVQIVESAGEDTAFNVANKTNGTYIVDNQNEYTFKTSAGVYQIDVYRTFARGAPVPFRMSVAVR